MMKCIKSFLGKLSKKDYRNSEQSVPQLVNNGSQVSSEIDNVKEELQILPLPLQFKYDDIVSITDCFRNLIGSGGYGSVYKGRFKYRGQSLEVAVKKVTADEGGEVEEAQFRREMTTIASMHHSHLARLIGYCYVSGQYRFLVYEYMINGSLDRWIFGKKEKQVLDWPTRYRIAYQIARVLRYMHHECPFKILHLDIKPENILLDHEFEARLSDFGLSRIMGRDEKWIKTRGGGTLAYMAPEYLLLENLVSEKADVYSYGLLLFELIHGERNVTDAKKGDCGESKSCVLFYPQIVWEVLDKTDDLDLFEITAPGLFSKESFSSSEHASDVISMLCVAISCIQEDPEDRPSMDYVVDMFEGRGCSEGKPPRPKTLMLDLARNGPTSFMDRSIYGKMGAQKIPIENFETVQTVSQLAVLRRVLKNHLERDVCVMDGQCPRVGIISEFSEASIQELASLLKKFTFAELQNATDNFRTNVRVGFVEDSCFIGKLGSNTYVLVKRLSDSELHDGFEAFERKLSIISGLQHSNLPGVLGYCITTSPHLELLLTYALPPNNGSVDRWIFTEGSDHLKWVLRCQIAMDMGMLLLYLLRDCRLMIDARVMDPENVWLDEDFRAMLMNYDEIDVHYSGTSYECLFDDRFLPVMRNYGMLVLQLTLCRRIGFNEVSDLKKELGYFNRFDRRNPAPRVVRMAVDERFYEHETECEPWSEEVKNMLDMGFLAANCDNRDLYLMFEWLQGFKFQPTDPAVSTDFLF